MNELYEIAFSSVNLPYTVMLLIIVAYWLLVIIGLMDVEAFDIDLDTDFDMDADLDAGAIPGLGHQVFGFLNIGEVPVMFYVSIIVLSMWVGSVQTNRLLNNDNVWIAIALAVPNLIVALMIAKFVTEPFKWLNIRKEIKNEFEGMVCLVTTSEVTEDFGECEIQQDNVPIKIFARTRGEVLVKGDAAIVIERLKSGDPDVYLVTKHLRENL